MLRELECKKHIVLPRPVRIRGKKSPSRLVEGVAEAKEVPGDVGETRELRLIRVETEEQMRVRNELMIQGHPWKAGPLAGRQLYYLVKSEQGCFWRHRR